MTPTVKKISSNYHLDLENQSIYVEVKSDGKITLGDQHNGRAFYFVGSDPEMVRNIAKLMLVAVDLAEATIDKA